jgi:hypothetical protein
LAKTWSQEIVDRYPEVLIRKLRGIPFAAGYPNCSDGWRDIVDSLVSRISAAAVGYSVQLTEIRERHGRLTIFWKAECDLPARVERAIAEAIALAQARAACSCAVCGANGRLFGDASQLFTACPDHARGVPVRARRGTENVHIVQRYVNDHVRTLTPQRYDRARDRFVDIDSSSIGVDDWHEILSNGNIARTGGRD